MCNPVIANAFSRSILLMGIGHCEYQFVDMGKSSATTMPVICTRDSASFMRGNVCNVLIFIRQQLVGWLVRGGSGGNPGELAIVAFLVAASSIARQWRPPAAMPHHRPALMPQRHGHCRQTLMLRARAPVAWWSLRLRHCRLALAGGGGGLPAPLSLGQ